MGKVLMLIIIILPVAIFYILDKIFNLKLRLVGKFKSIKKYKKVIFIVLISIALFSIIITPFENPKSLILPFSIVLLYHYLNFNLDSDIDLEKMNNKKQTK